MNDLIRRGDAINEIKAWFNIIELNPDILVDNINSIPDVEPKQGEWIPCSERLPEEDGHYIVYAPSYSGGSSSGKEIHNGVMFSRFKSEKWSIEVGYHKRPNCVKAWMPIEPWKGTEDD